MSTVVYQELQSCYESNNLVESRQLSLKLITPKNRSICNNSLGDITSKSNNKPYNKCSNSNMFSWSGIEALSNANKQTLEKTEPEYIHPLVKCSSSKLSQKSLEMCTESLGCETGTCIMESSVFFQSTLSNQVQKPRLKTIKKKEITQVKRPLPPPLTSITGPNPIQVKPIREHGRLIINAVSTPVKRSCFHAERNGGRLTLTLVNNGIQNGEYCESSDKNEYVVRTKPDNNNNNNDDDNDEGRCTEVISKDNLEVKEQEKEDVCLSENMNDVKLMLGGKVRMVKIQTPSKCMERRQGNKRLVNWVPFWVAT